MLKFFAKCFDAICCIGAVLNFIIYGVAGGFLGKFLAENVFFEEPVFYIVMLALAGVAIGFFMNVFVFGFIAQITEIRRNLEEINENK